MAREISRMIPLHITTKDATLSLFIVSKKALVIACGGATVCP